MLELTLYFQQDARRIARRDYRWGRFIPKTKKVTRYCDRVADGFPCKQRGSRFKRNLVEERDGELRICSQPRDRMYAHLLRWQDAAPTERAKLIPMDYDPYTAWSENARLARIMSRPPASGTGLATITYRSAMRPVVQKQEQLMPWAA